MWVGVAAALITLALVAASAQRLDHPGDRLRRLRRRLRAAARHLGAGRPARRPGRPHALSPGLVEALRERVPAGEHGLRAPRYLVPHRRVRACLRRGCTAGARREHRSEPSVCTPAGGDPVLLARGRLRRREGTDPPSRGRHVARRRPPGQGAPLRRFAPRAGLQRQPLRAVPAADPVGRAVRVVTVTTSYPRGSDDHAGAIHRAGGRAASRGRHRRHGRRAGLLSATSGCRVDTAFSPTHGGVRGPFRRSSRHSRPRRGERHGLRISSMPTGCRWEPPRLSAASPSSSRSTAATSRSPAALLRSPAGSSAGRRASSRSRTRWPQMQGRSARAASESSRTASSFLSTTGRRPRRRGALRRAPLAGEGHRRAARGVRRSQPRRRGRRAPAFARPSGAWLRLAETSSNLSTAAPRS